MKLKHWAGYGSINAKALSKGQGYKDIEVSGNHEWGLTRSFHDVYCIAGWLKRFATSEIQDYEVTEQGYKTVNGLDTEYAIYRIYF